MYFRVRVGLQPPVHHPHPLARYIFKQSWSPALAAPLKVEYFVQPRWFLLRVRWPGKSCQNAGRSDTKNFGNCPLDAD